MTLHDADEVGIRMGETWHYRKCRTCGDVFAGNYRRFWCPGCGSKDTKVAEEPPAEPRSKQ